MNNSTISKRSYFSYSILNAITYGIYGVVTRNQVANDIETICAGDGQQPRKSFSQAWITSKLYNLLVIGIFGLPLAIAAGIAVFLAGGIRIDFDFRITGFLAFLIILFAVILLSFVFEGRYLASWWYTQHNRLVLNSHRYKMVLNDNAFDTAVWKAIMFAPMNFFSFLGYFLFISGIGSFIAAVHDDAIGFAVLFLFGGYLFGAIALFIKNIINLPFYYTLKSINRFAENMGILYPVPYDPMGLLDEDNKDNIFSRTLNVLNNFGREAEPQEAETRWKGEPPIIPVNRRREEKGGSVECLSGTNKGYIYTMADGEEFIIGKDPKTANIVISPEYKDVSRKHCGIRYSSSVSGYIVTDYSSNGTKINGVKMTAGKPETVRSGAQISLGKGDNVFKVK